MREAFRLNQEILISRNCTINLAFIYSAKEVKDFYFIEEKLILGLKRLTELVSSLPHHDSEKK